MHGFHEGSTCVYGPTSSAAVFGNRSRGATRQNLFARRRSMLKRKSRDHDMPAQQAPTGLHARDWEEENSERVLDRIKRLRMASPPSSPCEGRPSSPPAAAANDVSMEEEEKDDHHQHALTVLSRRTPVAAATAAVHARRPVPSSAFGFPVSDMPIPEPPRNDPRCTAVVVFDPHRALQVERSPRIELVNEEDGHLSHFAPADTDESDNESFVRFEEIHEDADGDQAMDID